MNNDEQIIARLRGALDEVEATRTVALAPSPQPAWGRQRLLAVAATVVLVGGAVTAVVVNLSNRDSVSPAAGGDTTRPTTAESTSPPLSERTMPYFLAAADLAPGPVQPEGPCCLAAGEMVVAWARDGQLAQGLLLAHSGGAEDVTVATTTPGAVDITTIDGTLTVTSYGLSPEERASLAAQIVPGSGLPWVLPVDGWQYVGMAVGQDTTVLYQQFGGAVVLETYLDTSVLLELATATTLRSTTVAGADGWIAEYPDGAAQVLWPDGNGTWARVHVPAAAGLSDRVDALAAAIVPTADDGSGGPATTVPAPGPWVGEVSRQTAVSSYALAPFDTADNDTAVGQPMPPIRLTDGTTLTVDTPTLFVFVADWCPHCNEEVPQLAAAVADGRFDGVRVVLVATGSDSTRAEWQAWLSAKGWTGDVIFDTDSGQRVPGQMAGYFGTPGYPYLVMVNSDGTVAARSVGSQSVEDIVALTETAH